MKTIGDFCPYGCVQHAKGRSPALIFRGDIMDAMAQRSHSAWWARLGHPSEKYDFVNWEDQQPNIWENFKTTTKNGMISNPTKMGK